jgi:NADPH-dependent ferric siderophore reductase
LRAVRLAEVRRCPITGRVRAALGPVLRVRIEAMEKVAPCVLRFTFSGVAPKLFAVLPFTDSHVRILFPISGVRYPDPFDLATVHSTLPRALWPRTRTYTVRAYAPAAGRLVVDFVDHGRAGLARGWLAGAEVGQSVLIQGPGGGYFPSEHADWHLLAGDHVALPAIATSLESMSARASGHAVVEVENESDTEVLARPAGVHVTWLVRTRGEGLVPYIRSMRFGRGRVEAFLRGEGGAMRQLRRHLLLEREMPLDSVSSSGYWRAGLNDEDWRAVKALDGVHR